MGEAVAAPQEMHIDELPEVRVSDTRIMTEVLDAIGPYGLLVVEIVGENVDVAALLLAVGSVICGGQIPRDVLKATLEAAALLEGADPWSVARRAAELAIELRQVPGAERWALVLERLLEDNGEGCEE